MRRRTELMFQLVIENRTSSRPVCLPRYFSRYARRTRLETRLSELSRSVAPPDPAKAHARSASITPSLSSRARGAVIHPGTDDERGGGVEIEVVAGGHGPPASPW